MRSDETKQLTTTEFFASCLSACALTSNDSVNKDGRRVFTISHYPEMKPKYTGYEHEQPE